MLGAASGQRDAGDHRGLGAGLADRGPVPWVAEPHAPRSLRVDRCEQQLLLELPGTREHRSLVVDDKRITVEHELVLPANQVAESDHGDVVPRALDKHALALGALAGVIRRGRDVDEHRRARERFIGRGRTRLPDVLANGQAKGHVPELDEPAARP